MSEAERFEKPEPEIKAEDYVLKVSTLKEEVRLLDSDDISNQMVLSYDAFTADKDFFYNYSELRGLTRAVKGPLGNWKQIDKINEECKGLKGVSMVIHEGKLLVRHEGIKDHPFVIYDKDTLKPLDEAPDAPKYHHPDGDDEKLKKLDWSQEKLPKTEEDDEEEKQTEEQKAEEERKRPCRRMGATPLASDGKHIYALSMQVKKEEEDGPYTYEKLTVEVFEIAKEDGDEGKNLVKRVKEFNLKKDDDNDWTYKAKKYNSDGGYFDHAQTACNGRVFILNLPHRTYFFKVENGVRFTMTDKRPNDLFQLVYEQDSNLFSAFKVNTFNGYHNRIKIKGFEKRKTEEEVKKTQAPEVLQSRKEKLTAEIEKCEKDQKEPEKMSVYE